MGEIADAMLEGALCQGCGEYLGEDGVGPRYCAGCKAPAPMHYTTPRQRRALANRPEVIDARKPFQCGTCGRRFKVASAVSQHARDVHR